MAKPSKNAECDERIVVTGIGLVTPMAGTVWRSLAAVMHNRSCFFDSHPTILVAEDRYGAVLRGATVSRVTRGFERHGLRAAELACALLAPAIRDSVDGLRAVPLDRLSLRIVNGLDRNAGAFFPLLLEQMPDVLRGAAVMPDAVGACHARHSFIEQVIQAAAALKRREHRAVIVAGVDSLCFPPVLQSLMEADRLVSGSNPEGIVAGEAAGALLLEREEDARRREASIYATITSWGRGADSESRTRYKPSSAQGLTAAFYQAMEAGSCQETGVSLVIGDLNGERGRAMEWALVEGRVFANIDGAQQLWLPAYSVGDCGSAMGALQSVTAVGALSKGKSGSGHVVLFSTDDGGESRVLCFGPGEFQDRHALNRWRRKRRTQMLNKGGC